MLFFTIGKTYFTTCTHDIYWFLRHPNNIMVPKQLWFSCLLCLFRGKYSHLPSLWDLLTQQDDTILHQQPIFLLPDSLEAVWNILLNAWKPTRKRLSLHLLSWSLSAVSSATRCCAYLASLQQSGFCFSSIKMHSPAISAYQEPVTNINTFYWHNNTSSNIRR